MKGKWLVRAGLGLMALVVVALGAVKVIYGGGRVYPDVGAAPLVEAEVLVELDYPLGNVAAAGDRLFFNYHPFGQVHRFTDTFVFELVDGEPVPFPKAELQPELKFVFGMTVDGQQRLWLTCPATLDREQTRLMAIDLKTNELVVDHRFPPGVARFAQDLRVSPDGATIYMADTGAFRFTEASLLVVDTETFATRRLLAGHASTQPQDWIISTAHGPHRVGYGLLTFSVGVDGIALSPDGTTLYYATMSHDGLFRVPTQALRNADLSAADLAAQVERVGGKPLSDGIAVTPDGRILITDVEHGRGLELMTPDGARQTLVRDPRVVWADGVTVWRNSAVFTDSAIPSYLHPLLLPPEEATLRAQGPYRLFRAALPAMTP